MTLFLYSVDDRDKKQVVTVRLRSERALSAYRAHHGSGVSLVFGWNERFCPQAVDIQLDEVFEIYLHPTSIFAS
jgi:hypothetical protein